MGLSIRAYMSKKKSYKLSKKQQIVFTSLLAELLLNGFTLQESFLFMSKSNAIPKEIIRFLVASLEKGESLSQQMARIGFASILATQISFAQLHGQLPETLQQMSGHLKTVEHHRANLFKMMSYPMLLFFFLGTVLTAIRQVLLPQLLATQFIQKKSWGLFVIQQLPYYFIGFLVLLSFFAFFVLMKFKQKTSLQRAFFIAKLPVIGRAYQVYISAFFALEWGKLFAQGMDMQTIVTVMQSTTGDLLFKQLAREIEEQAMLGHRISEQFVSYPFFLPELSLIIQQGELKSKVGKELLLYSELCWQRFFRKIEQQMQWIQPLVFILVALLIVGIYAAMLMPIYGGMEDFL